jgi:tetratricopeptide (TPR) repeat protein
MVTGAILLAGLVIWRQSSPTPRRTGVGDSAALGSTNGTFRLENEATVHAAYGGSASCKTCHEEAFGHWKNSHHGLAERAPESSLDDAAFTPTRTVLQGQDQASVRSTEGKYEVVTRGFGATQDSFQVQRVLGHDPLRQFLVSFPGGRLQTLAASYDPRSNEWFNVFGDEERKPGEWGHWTGRGMNWNSMCAACHNTRVRKNYDAATDAYLTTMAEPTVSCEACHGPLKAHNEWQAQFGKSGRKDPTVTRFARAQTLDYCGSCHARRAELTGDFKPGDHFGDHFSLSRVDDSDLFYADGQVRDEDYEFSAFLGSRMYHRGVTCLDCHHPHTMKPLLPGNWLCMRCHDGSNTNAPTIQPVAHSRHKVFGLDTNGVPVQFDLSSYDPRRIKETGGECVNCHMPQTVYMQRHWRHDHGFTIPDPLLTKQHGIPNACNRCHRDKDTDWSIEWVNKWYGPRMNRPSRSRAQWIARAKEGEASARDALLATLKQEEIPYWRAVEAGMLRQWAGEPNVRERLLLTLNDPSYLAREAAVHALAPLVESGDPRIVAALRTRLDDPSRSVRVAAAALLGMLDSSMMAAAELRHFLEINADQPTGQLQLGIHAFSQGQPQVASNHLRKAVEWDAFSPPLREEFAVVLSALGRPAEAVDQLLTASRLAPGNAEVRYKLGLAYNELGDLANTLQQLQKAVELEPRHARAWYNLGLAQNGLSQTAAALQSLARAESLLPADARIPYARATILLRLNRLTEAKTAAERSLALDPQHAEAQRLLQAIR